MFLEPYYVPGEVLGARVQMGCKSIVVAAPHLTVLTAQLGKSD